MPSGYGSSYGGYDRRPISPLGSSRYETYEVRPSDSRREQDNLRRHGTIRTHPAERYQEPSPRRRPRELRREPSFDYGVPEGVDISMFDGRDVPEYGRPRPEPRQRRERRERSPSGLSRLFGGLGLSRSSSRQSSRSHRSSGSRRHRNQSPPDFDAHPPPRYPDDELDYLDSVRQGSRRPREPEQLDIYDVPVFRRGSPQNAPHYSPQQAYMGTYHEEAAPRRRRTRHEHRYPEYEHDTRAMDPRYYEHPYTRYR